METEKDLKIACERCSFNATAQNDFLLLAAAIMGRLWVAQLVLMEVKGRSFLLLTLRLRRFFSKIYQITELNE